MQRRVLVVLLIAVVWSHVAAADDDTATRPAVQAARVSLPPVIDGKLDDEAWTGAAHIDQFVQRSPRDGDPATEKTEVWIAYDSRNLYVAVYAHYSDPALIRARRVDRDKIMQDDVVAVYIDPFLDRQRAYKFAVNGYGVQADAIMSAGGGRGGHGGGMGGRDGEDQSWDALFQSRGGMVDDGWVVEVAIPFKSLRYPAKPGGEPYRWGFQILRNIEGKNEEVVWSPISRDVQGFLTQMGVLEGLQDLSTSKNLEILPTLTAVQATTLDRTTGAVADGRVDPEIGVNLKYGVTSNVTLDFTYNPDFSQIEADRPQIEVNQRFPLFYDEKRPFFLEGKEIFETGINVIHTRTIVDPRYGGKITGKMGKTTLGLLFANDEAPGRLDDTADPAFGRSANAFVGRVRYDLYPESFLGAIVTDRQFLDSYSRLAGVDGRFRLGRAHRVNFMAVAADRRNQEGSRSSGPAFELEFGRSGRHVNYRVGHRNYAPGFRTDLGFIRRNDLAETNAWLSYRFWPQNAIISWSPRVEYMRNYDHDGVLQDERYETGVDVQFAANAGMRAGVERLLERFGDIDFYKTNYTVGGNIQTSRFFSFHANGHWGDAVRYGSSPFLGRSVGGFTSVTLRPSSRLEGSFTFNLSRFTRPGTREKIFDVRLYRTRVTYQLTERLFMRNILEYDSWAGKFGANLLLTYRINSGTVAFLGYDDRLQRASAINGDLFAARTLARTNRTFFLKLSYLFRY